MTLKETISKFKYVSIFSVFSLSSVLAILIACIFIAGVHFKIIKLSPKITHIINEFISHESGVSVEEIEELEGIKTDSLISNLEFLPTIYD